MLPLSPPGMCRKRKCSAESKGMAQKLVLKNETQSEGRMFEMSEERPAFSLPHLLLTAPITQTLLIKAVLVRISHVPLKPGLFGFSTTRLAMVQEIACFFFLKKMARI